MLSPDYINFGINTGNYKMPIEWAEFFKMNRAFFENRDEAMKIVTELKAFKAKVNKQVELEADMNKGDRRTLLNQAVDSNMPKSFNLKLPLFKGQQATVIEVETYFNADDLTATLVSAKAAELIEDTKREAIDKIVSVIIETAPTLAIIYQ